MLLKCPRSVPRSITHGDDDVLPVGVRARLVFGPGWLCCDVRGLRLISSTWSPSLILGLYPAPGSFRSGASGLERLDDSVDLPRFSLRAAPGLRSVCGCRSSRLGLGVRAIGDGIGCLQAWPAISASPPARCGSWLQSESSNPIRTGFLGRFSSSSFWPSIFAMVPLAFRSLLWTERVGDLPRREKFRSSVHRNGERNSTMNVAIPVPPPPGARSGTMSGQHRRYACGFHRPGSR